MSSPSGSNSSAGGGSTPLGSPSSGAGQRSRRHVAAVDSDAIVQAVEVLGKWLDGFDMRVMSTVGTDEASVELIVFSSYEESRFFLAFWSAKPAGRSPKSAGRC